jgi:hypothetical protein
MVSRLYFLGTEFRGVPADTRYEILKIGKISVLVEFAYHGRLIDRNLVYWITFADFVAMSQASKIRKIPKRQKAKRGGG